MLSKDFRGEIWTNVDDAVMKALVSVNSETIDGCVGGDSYSLKAIDTVQAQFNEKIYATFTINGTGANIVALKAMLDRWSCIISAKDTHINVHESAAYEYTLGSKILYADSDDGKLTPELIDDVLTFNRSCGHIPKVVVITQPTELGVLYSIDELKRLCDHVHSLGMYVYVDGARLGNALAALNTDLGTMMGSTGVDAFSIGGTKSGAMFGEMVIFRHEQFSKNLAYLRKQSFQHFDKSKFMGVQFNCLFENDRWINNARIANTRAKYLEKGLREKGIEIFYPVDTNAIFAVFDKNTYDAVSQKYDIHYWDERKRIVRFVTSFSTTEVDVDKLIEII